MLLPLHNSVIFCVENTIKSVTVISQDVEKFKDCGKLAKHYMYYTTTAY